MVERLLGSMRAEKAFGQDCLISMRLGSRESNCTGESIFSTESHVLPMRGV